MFPSLTAEGVRQMSESTKHLVIDIQTGIADGIKLDAEGNCKAIVPYDSSIKTLDDARIVGRFGPLAGSDETVFDAPSSRMTLPFGKTTYAVELREGGGNGQLFT